MDRGQWELENQDYLRKEFLKQIPGVRYTNQIRRIVCEGCGRTLYTQVHNKKYCNWYDCGKKATFRRKHDKALAKRTDTVCGCCGNKFTPTRAGAKYCSNACRQKAYRNRDT